MLTPERVKYLHEADHNSELMRRSADLDRHLDGDAKPRADSYESSQPLRQSSWVRPWLNPAGAIGSVVEQ